MIKNLTSVKSVFPWTTFFVVLALFSLRDLKDLDIFTQLELGNQLLSGHQSPSLQPLAANPLRYTSVGWLSQICLVFLHSLGGWELIRVVAYAALATTLCLFSCLATSSSGVSRFLAVMMASFVMLSSVAVRPQIIALLCFALTHFVFNSSKSDSAKFGLYCLIFTVWQNCHPSLLTATLFLVSFCVGCFFDSEIGKAKSTILPLCLSVVCSFATPDGLHILEVSRQNVLLSRDIFAVSEWQPAWNASVIKAMYQFFALTVGMTLFLIVKRPSFFWREILPALSFLLLTLLSARFVVWFSLLLVPLLSKIFSDFNFDKLTSSRLDTLCRRLISVTSACIVSFSIPWYTFDPELPRAFINSLSISSNSYRIFNTREWGGPLQHFGNRQWTLCYDGRLYLYDKDKAELYNDTLKGAVGLKEIESKFKPNLLFLHSLNQADLVRETIGRSDWRPIIQNSSLSVFEKR